MKIKTTFISWQVKIERYELFYVNKLLLSKNKYTKNILN